MENLTPSERASVNEFYVTHFTTIPASDETALQAIRFAAEYFEKHPINEEGWTFSNDPEGKRSRDLRNAIIELLSAANLDGMGACKLCQS